MVNRRGTEKTKRERAIAGEGGFSISSARLFLPYVRCFSACSSLCLCG